METKDIKSFIFKLFLLIFFISLICFNCTKSTTEPDNVSYTYTIPTQENDGWNTASLSSVGMGDNLLENLVVKINLGIYGEVHAVLIVKDNKLVFEEYWSGHDFSFSDPYYHGRSVDFDMDTRQNTHSTTKSFTSALVGTAIDQGIILAKDDIIFDYLPESYSDLKNQGRENITIEHCLKMASGLEWNQWDVGLRSGDHDIINFNSSTDPIRYLLSKSVVTEPGTSFYYNGGTVDLLGKIISYAANQSVQNFSSEYLFQPLGITNYNWVVLQPSGLTCCHGDIHITPRDMAKFGQLFLDEGKWNGSQIISSEWVEQSTQNQIDPGVTSVDGYGYLWWLKDFQVNNSEYNSFKTSGWGGQEIFIFNDLDMVIVFTGGNYINNVSCDEIVRDYILASLN